MNAFRISYSTLALVIIIYVLSQQAYQFLLAPAPNTWLYNHVLFGKLFYLPLGVAIIITWLHASSAVVYLAIAGIIHEYIINANIPNYVNIISIANIALTPYLVMELFKACGLDVYQMPGIKLNQMWRTIILVTFASSVIIALLNTYMASLGGLTEVAAIRVLKGTIGGVSGTFLSLLIVYFAFVLFGHYIKANDS